MARISVPPGIVIDKAGEEIPSDRFNHFSQLEPAEPSRRDRRIAQQHPEDIPGNHPRAAAVAAVIDRQTDTVREIVAGDQRAVDGNRQRLLADPTLAEPGDGLRRSASRCRASGTLPHRYDRICH